MMGFLQRVVFHLKQGINTEPLWYGIKCIQDPKILCPHKYYKLSLENIRKLLSRDGVEAICFDKDNCITLPFDYEIHRKVKPAWEECLRVLGPERMVVISNSAGGPDDAPGYEMARRWEELHRVPIMRHCKKKPACGKDILNHFSTVQKDKIAVIGDRLFTDVLMANLFGLRSVLVDPLDQSIDTPIVGWMRSIEKRFLRHCGSTSK